MLGEKINATIEAKYYFGAPVTSAKVKYKVLRTTYEQRWYPRGIVGLVLRPGYWWFAADYAWYPGLPSGAAAGPSPWWWRPALGAARGRPGE